MKAGKQRNSSIELLRIVATLMIIAFHIYDYSVRLQLPNLSVPYKNMLLLTAVPATGFAGNVIFMMISGYFAVDKNRKNLNIEKTTKKLIFQLGFAAILITLASTVLHLCAEELLTTLIEINEFNRMAWYIGYYYLVLLIAYVFLNDFLAKQDRVEYRRFLLILFAVMQFSWSAGILEGLSIGLSTLLTGVFLYSFGGYIKRYDPFGNIKFSALIGVIAVLYLLLCVSTYNIAANNAVEYQRSGGTYITSKYVPEVLNRYIVPIITGVVVFEMIKRMPIPNSRVINYLGASTFMIFLVHTNDFFYSLYETQDWVTLLCYHPLRYILNYTLWTLGTFAIGVAAYSLYLLLAKLVKKYAHVFLKKDSQCAV